MSFWTTVLAVMVGCTLERLVRAAISVLVDLPRIIRMARLK